MLIKNAEKKHIEGIREIYNEAILNSTATFDTEIKSYEDRLLWLEERCAKYPVLVMEHDNKVIAWASLSKYSDRKAYDRTCEISIYIHKDFRGQGIGNKLMEALINKAKEIKIHTMISRVTGENKASERLHQKFSFKLIGTMVEVGFKFNKFIDVHIYQKMLN